MKKGNIKILARKKAMKQALLLTINCSISNTSKHFTEKQIKDLFMNIEQKKKCLSNVEKYAIGIIQTEASKEEIQWFKKRYNIPQESIDNVLSIKRYQ